MKSRDAWPDQQIDRKVNMEASKEMKVEAREQVDNSAKVDGSFSFATEGHVEQQNRIDPSQYSKWFRVHNVKKLEIGLSLVRVRSWVQMFINNCRLAKEKRTIRELTTDEFHPCFHTDNDG